MLPIVHSFDNFQHLWLSFLVFQYLVKLQEAAQKTPRLLTRAPPLLTRTPRLLLRFLSSTTSVRTDNIENVVFGITSAKRSDILIIRFSIIGKFSVCQSILLSRSRCRNNSVNNPSLVIVLTCHLVVNCHLASFLPDEMTWEVNWYQSFNVLLAWNNRLKMNM